MSCICLAVEAPLTNNCQYAQIWRVPWYLQATTMRAISHRMLLVFLEYEMLLPFCWFLPKKSITKVYGIHGQFNLNSNGLRFHFVDVKIPTCFRSNFELFPQQTCHLFSLTTNWPIGSAGTLSQKVQASFLQQTGFPEKKTKRSAIVPSFLLKIVCGAPCVSRGICDLHVYPNIQTLSARIDVDPSPIPEQNCDLATAPVKVKVAIQSVAFTQLPRSDSF